MLYKIFLQVLLLMLGLPCIVVAQPANFPVPASTLNQLFYLQRTPNSNTIMYELNLKDGKPNPEEPVHVFWIRYQETGQKQDLSYIQRKFAYGIRHKKLADNQYELSFVSYKKYKMYLQPGADGKYHIYAFIGKKIGQLNKIYLKIKQGGSFWSPNIEYVELTGTDSATGETIKEQIRIEPAP